MKIQIPSGAAGIIRKLQSAGYSAYCVGGCVRDSIMGVVPNDWDITTSAFPEETLSALETKNIIDSGLKHGTVTVRGEDGELYEITTFRIDGKYSDNRRPDSVTFVRDVNEDLARRDFTINAIAYNDSEGLCDPFKGAEDIERKCIRCVGDPDLRFNEDALRILRALRFASRLGFSIEKDTVDAMRRNKGLLSNISQERKSSELLQIIEGEFAQEILLEYPDIIGEVIPEILPCVGFEQHNPHHVYDVWGHTVRVVANSPHGKTARLAALLHDIGKPECFTRDENGTGHFHGHPKISAEMAARILRNLRLDNVTIRDVCELIQNHDRRPPTNAKSVRRLISAIGYDRFGMLMELKRADVKAQNPDMVKEKLDYIDELVRIFHEQTDGGKRYDLHSLAVNGSDIIGLGIKDGRAIGQILRHLLSQIIDGSIENRADELKREAERYYREIQNNGV